MKKILTIDGGGIRGIIPGQVLIALEKKLQDQTHDPTVRVADYFDFVAGTSSGGILTCLLLCPSESDPSKPRFSAQEAVDLYVQHGSKIFDIGLLHQLLSASGMLDEKFDATTLETLLEFYFGDTKLSALIKPCLITAYDIETRKAHFFAQHDFARHGPGSDFYLKDVCRATSAAPTYFETIQVKSLSGVRYTLIDGGVFANNPGLCAYSEVRNAKGDPSAKDMFIVSLGTGSENKSYRYEKARHFGAIGWIRPLIDIMMSGVSETTHYHLSKIFSAQDNGANYIRIQPAELGRALYDLDNATSENITALVETGTVTAESCNETLNHIVDVLLNDRDSVTF